MKKKTVNFTISGTADVSGRISRDLSGAVTGYRLKDGTVVKLVACFEATLPKGETKVVTSRPKLKELGFDITSYDKCEFEP